MFKLSGSRILNTGFTSLKQIASTSIPVFEYSMDMSLQSFEKDFISKSSISSRMLPFLTLLNVALRSLNLHRKKPNSLSISLFFVIQSMNFSVFSSSFARADLFSMVKGFELYLSSAPTFVTVLILSRMYSYPIFFFCSLLKNLTLFLLLRQKQEYRYVFSRQQSSIWNQLYNPE